MWKLLIVQLFNFILEIKKQTLYKNRLYFKS